MSRIAMIVWNEFRNDARVLKEAETLQTTGHHVTVFALHTPGITLERETLPSGVGVSRVARSPFWRWRKRRSTGTNDTGRNIPSGPIKRISTGRQILRIIARLWTHLGLIWRMTIHRPDVIHAHDVNTLPTAWLAAKLARAKIVYDAHEISTSREGYSSFRSLVARVERFLMPRVQGTITTTEARAKFFARAYGIHRPLVLQNRPRYIPIKHTQRIREELGLTEAWPIVLYQGGLQQGRGLERVVHAAAQVDNTYFVFIGGGRLEALLKALCFELNLEGLVFFIPTVALAELLSYTASADIGVQPIENTCLNHFTTDSNKLFEYVTAGLPIVASDLPEIRRVVLEHDLGLLVPPGDTDKLVAAIRRLSSDRVQREVFRKHAENAAQELSWEAQEGKLVSLYDRVLHAAFA